MASSPTVEIAGLTSPSTSPEQPGASPDMVSAAPGPDHAGGADIGQSPVQAQGGLAVGDDNIGDEVTSLRPMQPRSTDRPAV